MSITVFWKSSPDINYGDQINFLQSPSPMTLIDERYSELIIESLTSEPVLGHPDLVNSKLQVDLEKSHTELAQKLESAGQCQLL